MRAAMKEKQPSRPEKTGFIRPIVRQLLYSLQEVSLQDRRIFRELSRRKPYSHIRQNGPAVHRIGAVLLLICFLLASAWGQTALLAQDGPVHIVQPGETLSEIAQAYGVESAELMALNGMTDADSLLIGQRLRLPPTNEGAADEEETDEDRIGEEEASTEEAETPAVPGEASESAPEAPPVRSTTSLNPVMTVRSGDTLADIALRYGVDVRALRAVNGMEDRNNADLTAGETLILPATADELQVIPAAASYIVRPGDSLGQIARDHAISLTELLNANGIRNPDLLSAGQALSIPPPTDEASAPPLTIGPQRRGFYYYTVQPGDTLSGLAREFDSTVLALMEFNRLPDEQTVYTGLELRIPFGAPPLAQIMPPVPLSGTSFLVSLSRQECWLFEGAQPRIRWTCSTGYGEWITRTGTFRVQTMLEMAQSSAYRLDMPFWLGIYDVGEYENGIHGLPIDWDTGEEIWDGLIGQPATFGCAMLDNEDAAVLFARAYLGMPIHVMQ